MATRRVIWRSLEELFGGHHKSYMAAFLIVIWRPPYTRVSEKCMWELSSISEIIKHKLLKIRKYIEHWNWTYRETLQGGLPSNFIVTLEGSSTEFLVALPLRIGTKIEWKKLFCFVFFFLFFKWLFWVVLNILSTNELNKSLVFVGFDPWTSKSCVWRSINWATRDKLTGQ